jgi:hypothetical protein
MEKNIQSLCNKIFKGNTEIQLEDLVHIKQGVVQEILKFKFHSHNLKEGRLLGPEGFCKSIYSNLVPVEAYTKIKDIDNHISSGRIKGDITFNDFYIINRFFNEYKNYFKLKKTSNFSRMKFKQLFNQFAEDYDMQIESTQSLDNLFNLIDFDGNENLEYDELSRFLFRLNTGGRSDTKNQNSGFKPWYDIKTKLAIYQQKVFDIYDILKR